MMKKGKSVGAHKQELVDAVAAKAGITKENASTAIKSVSDGILELLERNGSIQLAKFGIFKMSKTAERQGHNPATGQPITIPAGYRISFKVSKTWKDSMMQRKRAKDQRATKNQVHEVRTPKPAAKAKPAAKKNWKKR